MTDHGIPFENIIDKNGVMALPNLYYNSADVEQYELYFKDGANDVKGWINRDSAGSIQCYD